MLIQPVELVVLERPAGWKRAALRRDALDLPAQRHLAFQ